MTQYTPIFRSPLTILPTTTGTSAGLRVSDLTGVPILLTQGDAGDTLQKHFSTIPANPGDLVDAGQTLIGRLTPDEFYLFGKWAQAKLPSAADLENDFAQANLFAHTTDYTHGRAVLKLKGAEATETLSKMCGLDFHDSVFPNMQVKQSSAAKIKTLIARCDEDGTPTYHLHVNRPFGPYFWNTLWDAGQEYGIAVG